MCRLLVAFIVTVLSSYNAGSGNNESKLKNLPKDPANIPVFSYTDYISSVQTNELNAKEVYRSANSNKTKKLSVIVNSKLYPPVTESINQYIADLEADGFFVIVHTALNTTKFDQLKMLISKLYTKYKINGVFLVGALPVAWFKNVDRISGQVKDCPCDLYFADINGAWDDTDGDSVYDIHSGNWQPEIYIARLDASQLTFHDANEIALTNNYFVKNHNYRTGQLRLLDKAYSALGADWRTHGFEKGLILAYPENTIVNASSDEFRINMKEETNNQYETVLVAAHSGFGTHMFAWNGRSYECTEQDFSSKEVETIGVQTLFMNLFACWAGDFTCKDSLIAWYTLQSKYGLNTIGSSISGSMRDFEYFYMPVGQGASMGEAMLSWSRIAMKTADNDYNGLIMFGDPTLRISRYMNKPLVGSVLPSTPQNLQTVKIYSGSAYLKWNIANNAQYYIVERVNNASLAVETFRSNYNYFIDTNNVLPSTMYRYRIKALNTTGESIYSSTLTVITEAATLSTCQAAGYGVYKANLIQSQIRISTGMHCEVYRSDKEDGEYNLIGFTKYYTQAEANSGNNSSFTEFVDDSAALDKKYYYKMRIASYTEKGGISAPTSSQASLYQAEMKYMFLGGFSNFPFSWVPMKRIQDDLWQGTLDLTNVSSVDVMFMYSGGSWWSDSDNDGICDDHGKAMRVEGGGVVTFTFNYKTMGYSIERKN